jgi:hypothetical protein
MSNYDIAKNPNTPPEILARLANDNNWGVRCRVAENLNTSPETLERLANDEDYCIRWHVAFNPNTQQYIRTYLKIKEFLK